MEKKEKKNKMEDKKENKVEEEKIEEMKENVENKKTKRDLEKAEDKKAENKEEKNKKEVFVPKEKAIVNGYSLRISKKASIAICKLIKGRSPNHAIERLEAVLNKKMPVPMASREVAHQKGKGIAGAKYPMNACQEIIDLLKQLEANSIVNGIESPIITIAKANGASRPYKSHGRRAKRTHIYIETKDKTKLKDKKD